MYFLNRGNFHYSIYIFVWFGFFLFCFPVIKIFIFITTKDQEMIKSVILEFPQNKRTEILALKECFTRIALRAAVSPADPTLCRMASAGETAARRVLKYLPFPWRGSEGYRRIYWIQQNAAECSVLRIFPALSWHNDNIFLKACSCSLIGICWLIRVVYYMIRPAVVLLARDWNSFPTTTSCVNNLTDFHLASGNKNEIKKIKKKENAYFCET